MNSKFMYYETLEYVYNNNAIKYTLKHVIKSLDCAIKIPKYKKR